jgi:hypothetical protein
MKQSHHPENSETVTGALYGMELGSVTLKRIGFFCFPIKHSTHTLTFKVKNKQSTL